MTKLQKILLASAVVIALAIAALFFFGDRTEYTNTPAENRDETLTQDRSGLNPAIIGRYFEPHGAEHYVILNVDGTFVHNRIDAEGNASLVTGTFYLEGENITFEYHENYPDLHLKLTEDDLDDNWYIEGSVNGILYYFVKEQ